MLSLKINFYKSISKGYVFHHVNLNFGTFKRLIAHFFFVSGVFQNFDVDFWP